MQRLDENRTITKKNSLFCLSLDLLSHDFRRDILLFVEGVMLSQKCRGRCVKGNKFSPLKCTVSQCNNMVAEDLDEMVARVNCRTPHSD